MRQLLLLLCLPMLALLVSAADVPLGDRFEEGDKVPNFRAEDIKGENFNLRQSLRDNRKTLLVFMRHAWCPVCNTRTHELINNYEELRAKGFGVVVVYESKPETLARYAKDYNLPYTVIADPDGDLYRKYKVEYVEEKKIWDAVKNKKDGKRRFEEGQELYEGSFKDYMDEENQPPSLLIPADFILDEKGRVDFVYYGKHLGDFYPMKKILNHDYMLVNEEGFDETKYGHKENKKKAKNPEEGASSSKAQGHVRF